MALQQNWTFIILHESMIYHKVAVLDYISFTWVCLINLQMTPQYIG